MQSRWNRWLSVVGAVALIGGLVLTNYGGGITPVEAHGNRHSHTNPFKQILDKLDQILAMPNNSASSSSSSSGAVAGNYTNRWDTNNPSASRFVTAFTGAVLDKNTGLVWEQAPDVGQYNWSYRDQKCLNKAVGGTRGWRLPSVVELASLVDPTVGSSTVPKLPAGHPFSNIQTSVAYWSATSYMGSLGRLSQDKWSVEFVDGLAGTTNENTALAVWCVRGPMSESTH